MDVPAADGAVVAETCRIQFRLLGRAAHRELLGASDAAFLAAVIVDWQLVCDEDGAEIPCTPEAIERLADIPYFARAVALAYADFSAGIAAKN